MPVNFRDAANAGNIMRLLSSRSANRPMATRTYTFGVRFRKGFNMRMLPNQAGMDRFVYNKLLEAFREEYSRTGRANTTKGRINAWYTDLRNQTGPHWLRQSVSKVTRQTLIDLGRHYE